MGRQPRETHSWNFTANTVAFTAVRESAFVEVGRIETTERVFSLLAQWLQYEKC
jgi:hypothetical protein